MKRTDPDRAPRDVFVLAERYPAGDGPWHAHRRAQLVYASEGVLTVRTDLGRWVVPPQRGVWILPGVSHQVSASRRFVLHTLYAEVRAVRLPDSCRVVAIDPLVRELLIAAAELGPAYDGDAAMRLVQVLVDRLPAVALPLSLPAARDPGVQTIAAALQANPADARTLAQHAKAAGMTARTAARRFVADTGLTFAAWRQQLRLLVALERLGAGDSVTAVALDVGYRDVSSFIAVFKAALGDTPARYVR